MNYKPKDFHNCEVWSWFQYIDRGESQGPHVLPVCYFIRLKAGVPYSGTVETSVVRNYDSEADALADLEQAVAAFEAEPRLGTPINELSGRPGTRGYAEFCRISESYGYP